MSSVTEKRLVFLTGDEGVGKTTIAAALALLSSRRGQRVLVISTDDNATLSRTFDWEIGEQGAAVCAGVHAIELKETAEESMSERVCRLIEEAEDFYDTLIFDSFPLCISKTENELARESFTLFKNCYQRFQNENHTAFIRVFTPERLPLDDKELVIKDFEDQQLLINRIILNRSSSELNDIGTFGAKPFVSLPLMPTDIHGIGALQQTAVLLDQSGL